MIRILQLSDLHIHYGAKRRMSILNSESNVSKERIDRITATVEQTALLSEIDAIVISGDLFDKRVPLPEDYEEVFSLIKFIREEYKIPVYILAGNHDDQSRIRQSPLFPLQHLYESVVSSEIDAKGLAIRGPQLVMVRDMPVVLCPWGTTVEQLQEQREELVDGGMMFLHVGVQHNVFHWAESELELGTVGLDTLKALECPIGIGHYHGQTFFTPDSPNPIAYCGSLECFNFGEEEQYKGALLWEFDSRGTVKLTPIVSDYPLYVTYTKEFLNTRDIAQDVYRYVRLKDTVTVDEYKALVEKGKTHACLGVQYALRIQNPDVTKHMIKNSMTTLDCIQAVINAQPNMSEDKKRALLTKHNEIEQFLASNL